jgi:hypothetical protein
MIQRRGLAKSQDWGCLPRIESGVLSFNFIVI